MRVAVATLSTIAILVLGSSKVYAERERHFGLLGMFETVRVPAMVLHATDDGKTTLSNGTLEYRNLSTPLRQIFPVALGGVTAGAAAKFGPVAQGIFGLMTFSVAHQSLLFGDFFTERLSFVDETGKRWPVQFGYHDFEVREALRASRIKLKLLPSEDPFHKRDILLNSVSFALDAKGEVSHLQLELFSQNPETGESTTRSLPYADFKALKPDCLSLFALLSRRGY